MFARGEQGWPVDAAVQTRTVAPASGRPCALMITSSLREPCARRWGAGHNVPINAEAMPYHILLLMNFLSGWTIFSWRGAAAGFSASVGCAVAAAGTRPRAAA